MPFSNGRIADLSESGTTYGRAIQESVMQVPGYAAFEALDPFFRVVEQGPTRFVDGEHYFDTGIGIIDS